MPTVNLRRRVMMESGTFSHAIEEHLELQRRNGRLETSMPISAYRESAPADASEAPPGGAIDAPTLGGVPPEIEVDPTTGFTSHPGTILNRGGTKAANQASPRATNAGGGSAPPSDDGTNLPGYPPERVAIFDGGGQPHGTF
jgi:hypothetical protein